MVDISEKVREHVGVGAPIAAPGGDEFTEADEEPISLDD
jgi:hypothetical protein